MGYGRRRYSKRIQRKSRYITKKKNRTASYHNKTIIRSRKGIIMRPLATPKQMFYFQNSIMGEQTMAGWATGVGHRLSDITVGNFLSTTQFAYIKATYTYWRLWNIHLTFKVIGHKNMVKTTDFGTSIANYATAMRTDRQNFCDLFIGFFRSNSLQTTAGAIDPDDATNGLTNKEKLLENNYYRSLSLDGYPQSIHWYQPKAFQGAYSRTDAVAGSTIATTISDMFAAILETNDQPHGYDLMIFDRDRWPNPTAASNKGAVRYQIFGTACIECTGLITDNL